MSKRIRVSLDKVKKTKGRSNWAYLKAQTDEQIHANTTGDRSSRELTDIELRHLTKTKKI
ncbi:MAG TPA: hypothetical protein VIM41_03805 [Gammaproteobacteria bacterium]